MPNTRQGTYISNTKINLEQHNYINIENIFKIYE